MADQLPLESMHDIFSRMPVKSLARFRCVSNTWCSYINDSYLETMHAKRAAVDDNLMLIMFHQSTPSADPLNSSCTHSFLEYQEEEEGTLEVKKKPPVMKFPCKSPENRYPSDIVLGSCNGLLYSSKLDSDGSHTFVVINPLREECYELPPINKSLTHQLRIGSDKPEWGSGIIDLDESSGLGFDESTNTFKMVCVVLREHVWAPEFDHNLTRTTNVLYTMVHELGTDSWRKIPQVPPCPMTNKGVFANGCLHWLQHDDFEYLSNFGRAIITFDMVKEEFGFIDPPGERSWLLSPWVFTSEHLVNLHGEIGYVCISMFDFSNIEVWVLKESGWVMHCEFESPGCMKVLGLWNKDGDVLFTDRWNRMIVYSLENDSLNEVSFDGWKEERLGIDDIRMYEASLFSSRYSISVI